MPKTRLHRFVMRKICQHATSATNAMELAGIADKQCGVGTGALAKHVVAPESAIGLAANASNHPATAGDVDYKFRVPPWLGVHCIVIWLCPMAKHGVGGAAHRLATGGVGSSPAVSIKETRVKVLRHMLRTRDRWLQPWQDIWQRRSFSDSNQRQFVQWDAERKAIRERIKELARVAR